MSIEKFLLEGEKAESFTIEDVVKHGCSGGIIPSLIYYHDTVKFYDCLLYTSPSPRDGLLSRMPSSA